jgi:tetratricopeptide (TPR) repeat protein
MNVTRKTLLGVALAIFAGALWLHWPSVQGGFLDGDDKEYLEQAVRCNGLTWEAVKWAFTTTEPYYQPLPRLSHVLDYQLWGRNAAGHHATSVVLHALNAAIVFGLMWTLLGAVTLTTGERLATAGGVAVVFAIHPLQVESVAWISGRTQMLCALFGIGCLWAYAANRCRWTVGGLFALALLCKPMAVSLPFVMVAMDYFPLRRQEQLGWGRLLREKVVLVALAAVVSVAAITTEVSIGETVPLAPRVWMVFPNLMFYPWRLVFPVHFAPFYSMRLGPSPDQWRVIVSMLSVGMITALAVWGWRRLPALAAAWGAYLAFVLPVTGLVHGGSAAPRHAYLAMLPLLPLAGGAVVWLWRRSPAVARYAVIGVLTGELCVFGVLTCSLIPDWHNDETVQRAVLAWFPDSEFANRALALTLLGQGRADEALPYAQRDVQIAPQLCWAHMTLGYVLNRLRQLPEAVEQYEQALQINPNIPEAHQNLGIALDQMGRVQEAIGHYEEAVRIRPDYLDAHYNLGLALWRAGQLQGAIGHYQQALRINPDFIEAHVDLGIALSQLGSNQDALAHFMEALRLRPDSPGVHYNLGRALVQAGKVSEAVEHFEQALRLKPDFMNAQNSLAWSLATRSPAEGGNPARAIALAQEACERSGNRVAMYLDTLAVAYAAAGRFDEASTTAERAIELARSGGHSTLAARIETRLELYRSGRAYRETAGETTSQHP